MSLLVPFFTPNFKPTGTDGNPLPGGLLYTYAAGTTTPLATYSDAAGTIPNTNPVVLDANGQARLYLGGSVYKFVLQDANGVVQWTFDQYSATTLTSASSITGVLSLSQLPDYPLSRIIVNEDTGAAGWHYQLLLNAGTQVTQRPTMNFAAPLQAVDNNGANETDISLLPSGVAAGSYQRANLTVDALGRITAASTGPQFPAATSDANGSSLTFPDGTIMKWGTSQPCPTGGPHGTVAVTFPQGAFTQVPVVVCTPDNNPDSHGVTPLTLYAANITVNGFNANFDCAVEIGGGGASNIVNVVHANWKAIGK